MQLKHLILFGTIGLLTLAGCGAPEPTASQSTETGISSSQSTETGISSTDSTDIAQSPAMQDKYPELLTVVSNTKTAVEAEDLEQAEQAFDQFEDAWSEVEDGIKDKSADAYEAIEENMEQVTAALRSNDKEEASLALQSLEDNINQIPQ